MKSSTNVCIINASMILHLYCIHDAIGYLSKFKFTYMSIYFCF